MQIDILAVGKIKEKYIIDGIKEFSKRLQAYCELNIIEVSDEKAPEGLSDKEIEKVKQLEGEKLMQRINDRSFCIALDLKGKELSSEDLSEKLTEIMVDGYSNISFIIGGSLGLSKEAIKRANYKLSFSKLTFPHQLMRLILLEQIYRSFRIMHNQPYHK